LLNSHCDIDFERRTAFRHGGEEASDNHFFRFPQSAQCTSLDYRIREMTKPVKAFLRNLM
jgi:hypothetical protein